MPFIVHNQNTAPEKSKEQLQIAERAFSFAPNLIGVLAESSVAAKAYLQLSEIFDTTSLSVTERQVVLLTVSRCAGCHYCVAAHTTVAVLQKVPLEVINAVRNDQPIAIYKLEALRTFTISMVDKRGWISDQDLAGFFEAGFKKQQVLEVIVGISMKTLSNYVNHICDTPVDSAFTVNSWSRDSHD